MTYFLIFSLIAGLSAPQSVAGAMRAEAPISLHEEPLNLSKAVGDSSVILIGDDHTQVGIKTFLTNRIKELRDLGFACLGIEMLPMHLQPALDRWNEADKDLVRQHLDHFWAEKGPGIPAAIFRLIASAKKEGLMVTALDPDTAQTTNRENVNPFWVECIRRCLSEKNGNRMIVFGGLSHFAAQPNSALSLLRLHGIRVSTLEFAGLESRESLALDVKTAELLGQPVPFRLQVTEQSRRGEYLSPFMVQDLGGDLSSRVSRWIIALAPVSPQIALNSLQE